MTGKYTNLAQPQQAAAAAPNAPVLVDVIGGGGEIPHGTPLAYYVQAPGDLRVGRWEYFVGPMPGTGSFIAGLAYGVIPAEGPGGKMIIHGPMDGLYLPQRDEDTHAVDGYDVGNAVMLASTGLAPSPDFTNTTRQIRLGHVLECSETNGKMFVDIEDTTTGQLPSTLDEVTVTGAVYAGQLQIGVHDPEGIENKLARIVRPVSSTVSMEIFRLPLPPANPDGTVTQGGTYNIAEGSLGPRRARGYTTDATPARLGYAFAGVQYGPYLPAAAGAFGYKVTAEIRASRLVAGVATDWAVWEVRAVVARATDGTREVRTPEIVFADSLDGGAHGTWTVTLAVDSTTSLVVPEVVGAPGAEIYWDSMTRWI